MWPILVLIIVYVLYEVSRYVDIRAVFDRLRLVFIGDFVDQRLVEIEQALASRDPVLIHSLQTYMFDVPPGASHTVDDANFLKINLEKLYDGRELTQKERDKLDERIDRVSKLLAEWNKSNGRLIELRDGGSDPASVTFNEAILHNTISSIHVLWTPSILDIIAQAMRHSFELSLVNQGFKRTNIAAGIPIWERQPTTTRATADKRPPILWLHGISCIMNPLILLAGEVPGPPSDLPHASDADVPHVVRLPGAGEHDDDGAVLPVPNGVARVSGHQAGGYCGVVLWRVHSQLPVPDLDHCFHGDPLPAEDTQGGAR